MHGQRDAVSVSVEEARMCRRLGNGGNILRTALSPWQATVQRGPE